MIHDHAHAVQLIAMFTWALYNVVVYLAYGWLKSVSASFYSEGNLGFIFTLTLLLVAVLTVVSFPTALMFMSGTLLCLTAIDSDYKEKQAGVAHIVGATGSMVLGFAALITYGGLIYIIPAAITGIFFVWSNKNIQNPIYWTEQVGFYAIMVSLLTT